MKLLLLLSLIFVFVQIIYAQTSKDNGRYVVYIGNTIFAEETYAAQKQANGAIRLESQVVASGSATKFVTITKNGFPAEFFIEANGKQVLTATFAGGEAKVLIAGQAEKTVKSATLVILENGVWSQYFDLLAQYDRAKGGAQNFVGFLPTQALNLNLTLEKTDAQDFKNQAETITVEKYKLRSANNLIIEIWTDKTNNVPVYFDIPSQQVKVVRQGFEFLRDAAKLAETKTFNGEFVSEEVSFDNGQVKLVGTLTVPKSDKKQFPAAVIITGSGGQDRDGAASLNNLYKEISESLSRAGVAVLRVDDRGTGTSTIIKEKGAETSYRDLISDARAAFDYLTTRREIDRHKIAFVGHSEGAETALTLASEDKRVFAIAILAGSSRPVYEVLLEQEMFQRALQETIEVADKTKVMPLAQILIKQFEAAKLPANAADPKLAWFREHLNSNPSKLAGKVVCPVLIVQGERDALVLPHHAIELANALTEAGNKNVSLRILPNLTHLFAPVDSTTVSSELLKTLQIWADATLVK